MKRNLLLAVLLLSSIFCFAEEKQEIKYRRSSLYTIMIPNKDIDNNAKEIIVKTFNGLPIPDKYNDHNLLLRDLSQIYEDAYAVSEEEINAANENGAKKDSKFGAFAKSTGAAAASEATGVEIEAGMSDAEYIARLNKYFTTQKVAHSMIEKWYNYNAETKNCDLWLINDRGLYSASEEEKAVASNTKSGMNKLQDAAARELLPKTFVVVTRYSYLPAEDMIKLVAGPATMAAAAGGGIAAESANATIAALEATLKGYFVKTTSYLFRLKWNDELQNKIELDPENGGYWGETFDIDAFRADTSYGMEYVGKTWSFAPATLKLTFEPGVDDKLIEKATVRATDKSIAQLQKSYEEFRTMSPVQVSENGKECYAYIGLKEGVKAGDKFDVFMPQMDEDGNIEYKKVTTIKAIEGKIWDNRFGAGETLEGETVEEDAEGNADLNYTTFTSSKKIMSGMLLKQSK